MNIVFVFLEMHGFRKMIEMPYPPPQYIEIPVLRGMSILGGESEFDPYKPLPVSRLRFRRVDLRMAEDGDYLANYTLD